MKRPRCGKINRRGNICARPIGHTGKHLRAVSHAWYGAKTAALRRLLEEIKVEKGCIDCGYHGYPEALDFDHPPGVIKLGNVSQMTTYSKAKVLAEVAKCEIVCANCHRHRTRMRKNL